MAPQGLAHRHVTLAGVLAALVLCASPTQAASTCSESGIAPPSEITLAAAASGEDVAVLVKDADCDEEAIAAVASENPGEYMINASYMDIVVVESYPEVASLRLWNNKIDSFKAVGTTVTEIDLTSNQISSLSGFEFPSSVQMLTFDLNTLKSSSASDFPDDLLKLYLRKNSITSLAKFRFSTSLQNLYLNGNQQLTTLEGAVFPDSLQTLECSDCRVAKIEGVVFPSSLTALTLGGTTVTTFVVRESDVEVLQSATLGLTASVSSDDCSSSGGSLTALSDDISACVLDDTTFSSLYPTSSNSGSSESTDTSSTTDSSSTTAGSLRTSDSGSKSMSSNGSSESGATTTVVSNEESSSSQTGLYVGVVVAVVVVVLAIAGFFIYRRRRNKSLKNTSPGDEALLDYASTDGVQSSSMNIGSTSGVGSHTNIGSGSSKISSSAGYLSNDVRNDDELIPYRLPMEDIAITRQLAVGGYGIVYLAQLSSKPVVVKRILPNDKSKANLPRFMDEIRLCVRMDHPKIVRFVGLAWTNLLDLSLILEYMPKGDLSSLLKRKRQEADSHEKFKWLDMNSTPRCKAAIALDVAEALVYMHSFSPPIIHRDLKSHNVLLTEDWTAKLTDFGVSRVSMNETMTGATGTTAWIAPEVLRGERYSETADVYSFGVVLSELDTCGHPYNSNRSEEDALTDTNIALLVTLGELQPTLEPDCPSQIRELARQCTAFHAADRPSAMTLHYQLQCLVRDARNGGSS